MSSQLWKHGATRIAAIVIGACVVIAVVILALMYLPLGHVTYSASGAAVGDGMADGASQATTSTATTTEASSTPPVPPPFEVRHLPTPGNVRAVYITSWAAGTGKFRKDLFDLIDKTDVNAVVIDVKDYTGRISFPVDDPTLQATGAVERRIPDIKEFIGALHDKGIYVIGRISAFQDSYMIKSHPEWAVKTKEGGIWGDYKGVHWVDAGAKPFWDYLVAIGKQSYAVGFDELNFDYIRFPSDGNMADTYYSWEADSGESKAAVLKDFFAYLHEQFDGTGIVTSADLFGLTTSAADDLGIGQVLTNALPYFDYVAPMVYPSHFADGFLGYANPAKHPYDVIKYSMSHAITKAFSIDVDPTKLRPWLQDFDLGAVYTPDMVHDQIQATADVGLGSWMLWNAASIYDPTHLYPKDMNEEPVASPIVPPPPPVPKVTATTTSGETATTTASPTAAHP